MNIVLRFIAFLLLFFTADLAAQTAAAPEYKNIINFKKLRSLNYDKDGKATLRADDAEKNWQIVLRGESAEQPNYVYNYAVKMPIRAKDLQKGEVLFISYEGRTLSAELETQEARVVWQLGVSKEPKDKRNSTISMSHQWQKYYIPFQIEQDVKAENLRLTLQFGYPPQVFEMRKMKVQIFPQGTNLTDLPQTLITYGGMESDASWRAEAAARIEQHRKGNFTLNFKKDGETVEGIRAEVRLQRHDFGWGAAFNAKEMVRSPRDVEFFSGAFNLGVFENDTKIKAWQRNPDRAEIVAKASDLLRMRGVDLKGHVLIWPGTRHLTPDFVKHRDNPEKLNKLVQNHLDDILTATAGKFSRWDVVNETYTNQDLQKWTKSEEILYKGFYELARRDSSVLRYTNEYGIINQGGLNEKKRQWYYDFIERTDENTGGLVDGIGIQSHIGSDLTPIPKVLEILDFYATLDKKISISEFTMSVQQPGVREQYTRDFMTAAFSHQSVFEFLFWAYKDDRADIFTPDLQGEGIMGKAFFDLVHGNWKTYVAGESDANGQLNGRGFYGKYVYSYTLNGQAGKGEFRIVPGQDAVVNVVLP